MKMITKYYDIDFIRLHSEAVLKRKGMPENDATIFVDSMLSADMCGVSTHGIRMLFPYCEKIDRGDFSFKSPSVIQQKTSFSIIDASNTVGAVSACYAVNIAMEQAKVSGIHTVLSRNCNTFGPGFYYAEKIADNGMIGFVCCNSPAAMPAPNGLEAMLGTNPFAFACPTKSKGNIVVDMATSIVAKSKFAMAKSMNVSLEPGWALDREGNPTTDPDEGIMGFVLPMAGVKGYGIAMVIDIVSGVLSGAGFLNNVSKFYSKDGACMNVGQLFIAINPKLIYEGDFLSDMDKYVSILRQSKSVSGKVITIPGDGKTRRRGKAIKDGILLDPATVEKLGKLFNEPLKECV